MKLFNIGSLNIDYVYTVEHFVEAGETLSSHRLERFPGGKGLNQSVALAKAGAPVIHGARVGNGGEFLLNTLAQAGADITRIEKVDAECGHAIIQVDPSGQNCILLFPGTNHRLDEAYIEAVLADAEEGDILLLQNETNALPELFAAAHRKGLSIALNPSPLDERISALPLEQVRWWFCNEIEGAALFGCEEPEAIADAFIRRYPHSALVLTLGKDGCLYRDAQQLLRQPVYPVKAVDTTAAGDTFTGYFLAAVMDGLPIQTALDLASRAASITVSRPGASVSIPVREEVIRRLNGNE